MNPEICVHCHYGFNRTGFVISCWLIEEEGYGVKEALEAFKTARPNGIRHVRTGPMLRFCLTERFYFDVA